MAPYFGDHIQGRVGPRSIGRPVPAHVREATGICTVAFTAGKRHLFAPFVAATHSSTGSSWLAAAVKYTLARQHKNTTLRKPQDLRAQRISVIAVPRKAETQLAELSVQCVAASCQLRRQGFARGCLATVPLSVIDDLDFVQTIYIPWSGVSD